MDLEKTAWNGDVTITLIQQNDGSWKAMYTPHDYPKFLPGH
jgi:hypothetical protein